MTTVSEHLNALGFTSDDHDANVREALLELRHARLSLAECRKKAAEPDWRAWKSHLIVCADCSAGDECEDGQRILMGWHHDDAPWLRYQRTEGPQHG